MTLISDLLDLSELQQLMEEGRITKQVHPNLPISIYNYTNKAQFVGKWTQPERVCRGLIVEDATGKIIARGPEKFFNVGQTGAPEIPLDAPVRVTIKEDGSLGIGWKYGETFGVATRGSFTSDQAIHATAMMSDHLKAIIRLYSKRNQTEIFEIVYPENRIVVDYGGRDELIKLGTVDNTTGTICSRYIPNILTKNLTYGEALQLPIPDHEEGYVIDVLRSFDPPDCYESVAHVKLKGETYKLLHGLLTNTNARRIWVQLAARACHQYIEQEKDWARLLNNDPEDFKRVDVSKSIVDTFLTNVPDEFYDWVTKKIDSINDTVSDLTTQAKELAARVAMIDGNRERYELAKDHPLCKEILNYVKSRDDRLLIIKAWNLAKPAGDDTPFKTKDD